MADVHSLSIIALRTLSRYVVLITIVMLRITVLPTYIQCHW